MRVVVAPDSFGDTLSAVEAATAIASGWATGAPGDSVVEVPLSDGGPGFVDVLRATLGGDVRTLVVRGPLGHPVTATWLLAGGTAYVESAQACGLHLVTRDERDPVGASTYGVGEILAAALASGAARVVVGLGGSATTDGGEGMLAALGRRSVDAEILAATDVDNPLLGQYGAARVFAPQKGADPDTVDLLERRLTEWAAGFDVALADRPGAGAAGGLGFALFTLGAVRVSGYAVVAEAVGLADEIDAADLAITGEGSFDSQSLRGKVVSGVAATARESGVPCVVLAGQVAVGRREAAAAGVESAYSIAEELGSVDAALADASGGLSRLAARVARQWSPAPRGG